MRLYRQSGLTLIELVVFIVIVSVALAGVMLVLNTAVRGSADPVVRKQALAIAESLLAEIEQQPFTYCDPDDANAQTAASAAGCATTSQNGAGGAAGSAVIGPMPNTETRGHPLTPFDNVADYGGYAQNNVTDITGANPMNGYNATVVMTRAGGVAPFATLPVDAVLRIAVTVTGGRENVTLVGYRFRYAPNL